MYLLEIKAEWIRFVFIATLIVFLAIGIVLFVFIYQSKIQRKDKEIQEKEVQFQKELVRASNEAQEREKKRIAVEMHDDVGSKLTALKFGINGSSLNPEAKESFLKSLQETIFSVRRLSNELMPSILDELGLIPASKNLISNLQKQVNTIHFDLISAKGEASKYQTRIVELSIYRILQELLNNCIKYSKATQIKIIIEQRKEGVELIIEDNGIGFDPSQMELLQMESLGLKNMNARAQQINASLDFQLTFPGTKTSLIWQSQTV
jgi:signal transduction histidine kinase